MLVYQRVYTKIIGTSWLRGIWDIWDLGFMDVSWGTMLWIWIHGWIKIDTYWYRLEPTNGKELITMVGGFRHVQIVVLIFDISIIFHVPISMNQPIQYRRSFRGVPSRRFCGWEHRGPPASQRGFSSNIYLWYTGYTIIETNPWIFS